MFPPTANHRLIARCLMTNRGKILLVLHKSLKTGKHFWLLPGGFVEPGEGIVEGALRELKEETGLTATPRGIAGITELPTASLLEIIVLFKNPTGNLKLGTDPEIANRPHILDVKWFDIRDIPPLQPKEFFRKFLSNPRKIPCIGFPFLLKPD